jgi:hypothetical protein
MPSTESDAKDIYSSTINVPQIEPAAFAANAVCGHHFSPQQPNLPQRIAGLHGLDHSAKRLDARRADAIIIRRRQLQHLSLGV